MEAIRDAGVQRVVLASSGAVYGAQEEQPLREDMIPNPDSPYAVSKLSAETYVNTIGRLWGIETVSLRIFNTYGPGQQIPASHAPVIPQFLKAARTGASLVVFGDGSQTRDFVHISDIVDALVSAATAPNINQRVINVGSGVETSMLALIEAVERVTGQRLEPIFNTSRGSGVARMQADLRQARDLLGYKPKIGLDEGLRRTLEQDPRLTASS